jgi:hypothetical protein
MRLYERSDVFSRSKELSLIEQAIDRAMRELSHHAIDSKEYTMILDRIVVLSELKQKEKNSAISKDTLAIVGANLLGIFMIIQHEHVNVITSRAMNLVMKPR